MTELFQANLERIARGKGGNQHTSLYHDAAMRVERERIPSYPERSLMDVRRR